MPILDPRLDFESPEEEEAYNTALSLGEAEWEHEVAGMTSAFEEPFIDAENVNTILYEPGKEPVKQTGQLLGMHLPIGLQDEYQNVGENGAAYQALMKKGYVRRAFAGTGKNRKDVISDTLKNPEPSIFAFGMDGNTPAVQAHEYRHMAIDAFLNMTVDRVDPKSKRGKALRYIKDKIPKNQLLEEQWVKDFDTYMGREAGNIWGDMTYELTDPKYPKLDTMTLGSPQHKNTVRDAWTEVEKRMRQRGLEFSKLEAAAQVYEGIPPPSENTTWQEYYMSQFEKRHAKFVANFKTKFNGIYGKDILK